MSTIVRRPAFFAEESRRRALEWEANSWVGTPFHQHATLKGVGVDCVHLAAAIYIATGFLDRFEPGHYNMDGGENGDEDRVIDWVEKSGRFARQPAGPLIGDLLCFRNGRWPYHVGVMISERQFVHACAHHQVMVSNIDDTTYAKRLLAIYRPMADGPSVSEPRNLQHLRD